MKTSNIFIMLLLIAIACSPSPVLHGFDSQLWQADKDGCKTYRVALANELVERKAELVGLGQDEIIT